MQIICKIYADYMQIICKIYADYLQYMQTICKNYAKRIFIAYLLNFSPYYL